MRQLIFWSVFALALTAQLSLINLLLGEHNAITVCGQLEAETVSN